MANSGEITLLIGGITPLITGWGPPCMVYQHNQAISSIQQHMLGISEVFLKQYAFLYCIGSSNI